MISIEPATVSAGGRLCNNDLNNHTLIFDPSAGEFLEMTDVEDNPISAEYATSVNLDGGKKVLVAGN